MTNREIWKCRETDSEKKARLMRLGMTAEEADDVIRYDREVDKNQTNEHDFTPEQEAYSKKMRRCERAVKEPVKAKAAKGGPTVYQFTKRERKPNATKGGLITALQAFLENNTDFEIVDVTVVNPERQISFRIGGDQFEVTLVQKRKPKQ